ncbi:stage VI sporulation protein F [Paenibacillus thermoaerophilus]|jgi:Ca2+-binding EF-hand superfamily protein|uniref:Stage VI sporulation protein F n=1 Tax=Paenibacillus thermoaerophilus TaxID=1215385 RepID=A0ABW2V6E7_9BACL|nr:stage VI sporulation protein F [Paenibacillus thermoaerophilus]TMV18720.1 hypothetical protein FE781_01930 [Paenibacillus thermoaerophilus]
MSDITKNILGKVNKKLGKTISPKDIQNLAKNVKPSTTQNEAQLRQLIKQVSQTVGVPVSEATMNDIVKAVKATGGGADLVKLMQMMSNKK